jgi:hypothetical protein
VKQIVEMQRYVIDVMERASLCRVVGEDRQVGRTWTTSAGEGAGRCLGRSAGRRA